MDIDEIEKVENDEAVRRYIRHPSDIPISFSCTGSEKSRTRHLKDVSCGGLSFQVDDVLPRGQTLHISIPLQEPNFEADAVVAWCREEGGSYTVGVEFDNDVTAYAMRMVEQVCHIEHYRSAVKANEGRELTSEDAAQEWVEKYAADFPHQ